MSTVNGFQVGSETLKYNYESLDNYNTPNFSTSSSTTYAVGDYVMYNGKLYKCTTATTGGTWVSSSWTETVLSDDVSDLTRQISDVEENQIPELKSAFAGVAEVDGRNLYSVGDDLQKANDINGYKLINTGVENDATRRLVVFPILDKPIYIKTQDGYQYRETISAATTIKTYLGAYEGFVYPLAGANYVAITFDKDNFIYVGKKATTFSTVNADRFVKAGNDIQAFNKLDCTVKNNIYLNASHAFIVYDGCIIICGEVNAALNDVLVFKFVTDKTNAIFGHILGFIPFVNNVLPAVGNTVLQDERTTIGVSNLRGWMKLNQDAKYFGVMIRFDTADNRDAFVHDLINGLVLKIQRKTVSDASEFPSAYADYYLDINQSNNITNKWFGKKIWWCGTSIPEGRDQAIGSKSNGLSYPEIVGNILGATVYNKSLGSSMCRANVRTGDYVHALSHNLIFSLTQTTEEKQYLIDHWDTVKTVLEDPDTYASLDNVASTVLGASFEARLKPYLDGTYDMPDLFVIDHGHNDWKPYYTMPDGTTPDTELEPTTANISGNILAEDTYMTANDNAKLISFFGEISAIPSWKKAEFIASVNRNCFIGAVNFLCTYILSKNPRARIVFIGNLDNWNKLQVQPAQESLAESWEFPLIKMWEFTGFSEHYIPNTATYWNPAGTTDLTVKQVYCADGVHPHSDTTGNAIEIYAETIANALKNIS